MSTYILTLFIGTTLLNVYTVFYSSRIFRVFLKAYPDVAAREIPFAFDAWAHPEKALFFFRRKAVELLRGDPILWPMRQRLVLLVVVSFSLPTLGALPLLLFALYRISQQ